MQYRYEARVYSDEHSQWQTDYIAPGHQMDCLCKEFYNIKKPSTWIELNEIAYIERAWVNCVCVVCMCAYVRVCLCVCLYVLCTLYVYVVGVCVCMPSAMWNRMRIYVRVMGLGTVVPCGCGTMGGAEGCVSNGFTGRICCGGPTGWNVFQERKIRGKWVKPKNVSTAPPFAYPVKWCLGLWVHLLMRRHGRRGRCAGRRLLLRSLSNAQR